MSIARDQGSGVRIGYVLRSYPRLSQTFILNEILALEQLGAQIEIFAMTNPREAIAQAGVEQVRAPVVYLEIEARREARLVRREHLEVMRATPRRYWRTWSYVQRRRDLDKGYVTCSRWECFSHAVYLAKRIHRKGLTHLHAHFAHDPTLIAMLAHRLTGISYSFTGHARDLYQIPPQALVERMADASAVVTCARANVDYVQQIAGASVASKLHLIYHGVDLEGLIPAAQPPNSESVPLIVSIGRLIEKKGFEDLICASHQLKRMGSRFRLEIYGEGPLRDELSALIDQLDLNHEVQLMGARPQRELVQVLQRATLFALTPFVTEDGDRDGIPNVLVEAMACGLPVVSTDAAGIPELVQHGENGRLTRPHAVPEIALELRTLLDDQSMRKRLGAAARRTVVEDHDLQRGARQMAVLFDLVAQRTDSRIAQK